MPVLFFSLAHSWVSNTAYLWNDYSLSECMKSSYAKLQLLPQVAPWVFRIKYSTDPLLLEGSDF